MDAHPHASAANKTSITSPPRISITFLENRSAFEIQVHGLSGPFL